MRHPDPAGAVPPATDATALRHAFGRFATGVTVVTTVDAQGEPVGLTVNSFSSLSLDPPLLLWSLRRASPSLQAFCAAPRFAVNVLAESHLEVSRTFAARVSHKFDGGPWERDVDGLPLLKGAAARFVCATQSHQDAGDHVLFIGRVLQISETHEPPLLFQGGRYRRLGNVL